MAKVLLVEDDKSVRLLMRDALLSRFKHSNIEVVEAEDGHEALRKLHPDIDLVITDFVMPGMNGLNLVRRIREKSPETKIIMATGSLFGHEIPYDVKLDDVIMKPFLVKDLVAAVARFI